MDELARLEENLHQETQAKENRNLQIVELEQTLAKESQRASDLKVTRETHSGAIHKRRRIFLGGRGDLNLRYCNILEGRG